MANEMLAGEATELLGYLKTLKESGGLNGLEAQAKAVADLKEAMRKSNEARVNIATNRPQTSDERALAKYLPLFKEDVAEREDAFFVNKGEAKGAIQMQAARFGGDNGEYAPGLLDDLNPVCDWQRKLQKLATERTIIRHARVGKPARQRSPITDRKMLRHLRTAPTMVAKIFADVAGQGAEWIPDILLPDIERKLEMERRVEANFAVQDVPPSGALLLPFQNRGLRPFLAGANISDNPAQYRGSSVNTADRTFTPIKLVVRALVDEDAAEDSIIAAMPWIQTEAAKAIVDGSEDTIINGNVFGALADTGIAGWDIRGRWGPDDLGIGADHRFGWEGLRARAIRTGCATDQGGAQTAKGFRAALAQLDSAQFRAGVMVIVSPEYLIAEMLGFEQTHTLDKFGPMATILTGELAKIYGYSIVLSEFVDKQYNASGVYDDTVKTKTGFVIVARDRFRVFSKRGTSTRMQGDITRGVVDIVSTTRKTFATFDASTTKNTHWSYNLNVA